MHTFRVGDTKVEDRFRKYRPTTQHWLSDHGIKNKVKGVNLYSSPALTVGGTSPLFHAVSYAFNSHCPLVITPDAAWLTILTGLTHHIDTDPEGLRRHFVHHDGKMILTVIISATSVHAISPVQWESVIHGGPKIALASFAEQLKDALNPKKFDLLVCGFSTTTPADRISSEVAMMGAMKHWFTYKMMLLCGLSTVTVEGTPEDWKDVIARVRTFDELGLGWWTSALLPVLEQIKLSCEGKPDIEFWKTAYLKQGYGSGSQSKVSGWINSFYPYIAGKNDGKMQRNPNIRGAAGTDEEDFPLGLVSAPVEIDDNGELRNAEFYGGLVGVSMSEDLLVVRPESGYAMQLL